MAISQQSIIRSTSGLVLGGVVGVRQFNSAIYIYAQLSLVAMATKFGTKRVITHGFVTFVSCIYLVWNGYASSTLLRWML